MTFAGVVDIIIDILIGGVVPFIITLALVVFLLGVVKYLSAGGSEVKMSDGVRLMTYGIIGLFVMFAVWGLVALLTPILGSTGAGIPQFK